MRVLIVTILLLFASSVFANDADGTYRVFDKDQNVVEIWKEKNGLIEVYNPDWSRKGYIKEEGRGQERYDRDWKREERIEKEGRERGEE